jgi:hypothetical protein
VKSRGSGTLLFDLNVSGSHYIWGLSSFQHTIGSVFEKKEGLPKRGHASPMSACPLSLVLRRMNSISDGKNRASMRVPRRFYVLCRICPSFVSKTLKL